MFGSTACARRSSRTPAIPRSSAPCGGRVTSSRLPGADKLLTAEVLRESLEALESGIALFDSDLALVYANPKFCEVHLAKTEEDLNGLSFDQVIGRIEHILGDESREAIVQLMHALARAPDGTLREISTGENRHFRFYLDRLSNGELLFVLRNVTAQRTSQKLAEQRAQQLKAILQSMAEGVSIFDAEDRLVLANQGFLEFYGLESRLAAEGTPLSEFSRARVKLRGAEGDLDLEREELTRIERIRAGTQDGRVMTELETALDGRRIEVRRRRAAGGQLVSTYMDVSDREAAAEALRTSEARFRTVVEDQTEMICRFDRNYRLTFVNPAYCKAFGRTQEDLVGSSFLDLLVSEEARRRITSALVALTPERPILRGEYAEHTSGGEVRWQSWVNRALFDQGGGLVEYQAVGRDVTREHEIKEALERSEQHFKSIAEAHPVPVLIFDRETEVLLHASPATVPLLGASVAVVESIEMRGFFATTAERQRFEASFWPRGGVDQFEAEVTTVEGRTLPAELTARAVEYEGRSAIAIGVVDITERRTAEREIARQQEALAQSEKLSALGSLLAGVSHELNNPLSIVVAQSQLMEELADDPKSRRRALRIREAAERCARIVKTFLAMARQKPPSRVAVDLAKLVEDAASLVAYALKTGSVELELDFASEVPEVSGDPDQLVQVIVNLLINAQQALLERPTPRRVRLSAVVKDQRIDLIVEDNGPGVPEEIRERIFEPFFTTKPEGLGTGIGLAMCRNIARGHGGDLSIDAATGDGARFVFSLPLGAQAEEGSEAGALDLEAWRALPPLKVLVVDDEPDIAFAIGEILERDGHEIATAETGTIALRMLRDRGFDVVLSDLRMPDLDGPGLFAAIREEKLHPTGRIGFLTGDTLGASVRSFADDVPAPLIEKPFQASELKAFVLRILRDGPGSAE